MASEGSCCRALVLNPDSAEGLPFIKILTLSLPLNEMLPSTSTLTDGTLSNTSVTLPP